MRAAALFVLLVIAGCGDGSALSTTDGGGEQADTRLVADMSKDTSKTDTRAGCDPQQCRKLEGDYAAAVKQAQACMVGAAEQCTKEAPGLLICGCPVWVNGTAALDSIRAAWTAGGCAACNGPIACAAIACFRPDAGVCTQTSSGGVCTPRR